jgi:tRNA pseudouridine38-40 synthase
MRSFKFTIAYDGTDFAGWQVQPGRDTIQGALQSALRVITGDDNHVIGSGRTDAGVHAIGQVASVRVSSWRHAAENLHRAINVHLPDSIVVTNVVDAADDFHAIRDAVGKRYRYQLKVGGLRSVFDHRYHWHLHHNVDVDAMRLAAKYFVGRHDFASFQATGSDRKTTTRTITACDVGVVEAVNETRFAIEVEADGFLYNMVRNIVGTLVDVGRRKQSPEWIERLILAKDRDQAGATAPPQGLFLLRVDYSDRDKA